MQKYDNYLIRQKLFLFRGAAVLGGCHGVVVAEKAGEGTAVGDAALLDDETNGVVGGGEQHGSMADAVEVDEVGCGGVGALAQGIVDIVVVGASEACQRLVVAPGIGVDGGVLYRSTLRNVRHPTARRPHS